MIFSPTYPASSSPPAPGMRRPSRSEVRRAPVEVQRLEHLPRLAPALAPLRDPRLARLVPLLARLLALCPGLYADARDPQHRHPPLGGALAARVDRRDLGRRGAFRHVAPAYRIAVERDTRARLFTRCAKHSPSHVWGRRLRRTAPRPRRLWFHNERHDGPSEREVKLFASAKERRKYDDLADLYSILVATEHLEKAFGRATR